MKKNIDGLGPISVLVKRLESSSQVPDLRHVCHYSHRHKLHHRSQLLLPDPEHTHHASQYQTCTSLLCLSWCARDICVIMCTVYLYDTIGRYVAVLLNNFLTISLSDFPGGDPSIPGYDPAGGWGRGSWRDGWSKGEETQLIWPDAAGGRVRPEAAKERDDVRQAERETRTHAIVWYTPLNSLLCIG